MQKRPLFGTIKSQSWARLDIGEVKQLEGRIKGLYKGNVQAMYEKL